MPLPDEIQLQPEIGNTKNTAPSRDGVWKMFDRIAERYDVLNRLLSLRQDVRWRRRMVHFLPQGEGLRLLDLATGTADVPLFLHKKSRRIQWTVGVDRARDMLNLGRAKLARRLKRDQVFLFPADAQRLPFRASSFDAVTLAFGIRNVVDLDLALREMQRVLRPGGRAIILEFSLPANRWFRALYLFYFRHILPPLGGWLSGDSEAYRYLNRSVETFPYGNAFVLRMKKAGFAKIQHQPLTFGIATIYSGEKPSPDLKSPSERIETKFPQVL